MTCFDTKTFFVQTGRGECGLDQKCAFIKKLAIFTQLLRNFVYLILTKFRYDWVKIVDFLIKAYFWLSQHSPLPVCI